MEVIIQPWGFSLKTTRNMRKRRDFSLLHRPGPVGISKQASGLPVFRCRLTEFFHFFWNVPTLAGLNQAKNSEEISSVYAFIENKCNAVRQRGTEGLDLSLYLFFQPRVSWFCSSFFFFFNVHFVFCIFVLLSFLLHADLLKKHRVFFVYRNEQNALEIQSPSWGDVHIHIHKS